MVANRGRYTAIGKQYIVRFKLIRNLAYFVLVLLLLCLL